MLTVWVRCTRSYQRQSHLVVLDLGLEFLYVAGGYWAVLNDAMSLFYQSLEILHLLLVLLVLHHSLLGQRTDAVPNVIIIAR